MRRQYPSSMKVSRSTTSTNTATNTTAIKIKKNHGLKMLMNTNPILHPQLPPPPPRGIIPLLQLPINRHFSDNLLGHNPMARPVPNATTTNNNNNNANTTLIQSIPGKGGIWIQSTAKKDKLLELKGEMNNHNTPGYLSSSIINNNKNEEKKKMNSLDDMANSHQLEDLNLADGLLCVVDRLDFGGDLSDLDIVMMKGDGDNQHGENGKMTSSLDYMKNVILNQDDYLQTTIVSQMIKEDTTTTNDNNNDTEVLLTHETYDRYIAFLLQCVENILDSKHPSNNDGKPLAFLRDMQFYTPTEEEEETNTKTESQSKANVNAKKPSKYKYSIPVPQQQHEALPKCQEILLLIQLQSTLQWFSTKGWEELTHISPMDIDRAAMKGHNIHNNNSNRSITIPQSLLQDMLLSNLTGSSMDRIRNTWKLVDHRDKDGLLEQDEMVRVVRWNIEWICEALNLYMEWALLSGKEVVLVNDDDHNDDNNATTKKKGRWATWKAKRREDKHLKLLRKLFQRAKQHHFEIEVELASRLRCIYAWADKAHQNSKVESVLIENNNDTVSSYSSFSTPQKRYVELDPKISLEEFLDVQQKYLPHLEKIGSEICQSFREELLVHQGIGRQNQELKKEIMVFLLVVSVLDVAIVMN
eukprot:CAMPEP_0184864462 /NCGR_PEP_ID=MMETSP0580-20130426/15054_1 /TAXON_ID=1118495 /ORGANISM="Dactyliosolen fragilissimus" /LENGTH=639 /DNA_ID=CAMNT_0027363265 /DNA_START=58 /DNA_END=1977 /DNA_ORIENTATION=+